VSGLDTAAATPAIETRSLTKLYQGRAAVRELDLTVAAGEKLVIFGPNGAGKTTLIRLLATLVRPSSGQVFINGIDVAREAANARKLVSVVSHQSFLYDGLTLEENLQFYGRMYGLDGLAARIDEVIALVRMESRRYERVGRFSRGLEQRAAIARALLHRPAILLLDEPETGLDPQALKILQDVLLAGDESRTLLYTTHNLAQGIAIADRIIILDGGRIVWTAPGGSVSADEISVRYHQYTGIIR
jgi:heme exporter protein A